MGARPLREKEECFELTYSTWISHIIIFKISVAEGLRKGDNKMNIVNYIGVTRSLLPNLAVWLITDQALDAWTPHNYTQKNTRATSWRRGSTERGSRRRLSVCARRGRPSSYAELPWQWRELPWQCEELRFIRKARLSTVTSTLFPNVR